QNPFAFAQGFGQSILPSLLGSSDPGQDPFMQNFAFPGNDISQARNGQGFDAGMNNFWAGGSNPNSQGLFDSSLGLMNGQNPYMQNLGDIGSYLMSSGGMNGYNQGALDNALSGIRSGGFNPQINNTMSMFGGMTGSSGYTPQIGQMI